MLVQSSNAVGVEAALTSALEPGRQAEPRWRTVDRALRVISRRIRAYRPAKAAAASEGRTSDDSSLSRHELVGAGSDAADAQPRYDANRCENSRASHERCD